MVKWDEDIMETMILLNMTTSRVLTCCTTINYHVITWAYMCLWNKSLTGRGGCEIGSAILKILHSEDKFATKTNLTIWSDNSIGQYKKPRLFMVFIYLVATGSFIQTDQTFLVPGYLYLPYDRNLEFLSYLYRQISRR